MKIIDEKGRLFGKINLIDLLVIILVIAIIAAVGWKLVGKKAAASVSDNTHETFTVLFEDQPAEVAQFAETQIGKQLVNNAKLVSAEVTGCEAVSSIRTLGHVDLSVTVKATATYSGNVWTVGSQEVRVGYEYILKTSEFELTGIISDMEADNG